MTRSGAEVDEGDDVQALQQELRDARAQCGKLLQEVKRSRQYAGCGLRDSKIVLLILCNSINNCITVIW